MTGLHSGQKTQDQGGLLARGFAGYIRLDTRPTFQREDLHSPPGSWLLTFVQGLAADRIIEEMTRKMWRFCHPLMAFSVVNIVPPSAAGLAGNSQAALCVVAWVIAFMNKLKEAEQYVGIYRRATRSLLLTLVCVSTAR